MQDLKAKDPQVMVTVITDRWEGVVEKEIGDFMIKAARDNPIKHIQVFFSLNLFEIPFPTTLTLFRYWRWATK